MIALAAQTVMSSASAATTWARVSVSPRVAAVTKFRHIPSAPTTQGETGRLRMLTTPAGISAGALWHGIAKGGSAPMRADLQVVGREPLARERSCWRSYSAAGSNKDHFCCCDRRQCSAFIGTGARRHTAGYRSSLPGNPQLRHPAKRAVAKRFRALARTCRARPSARASGFWGHCGQEMLAMSLSQYYP
jgi:hypothetical protein